MLENKGLPELYFVFIACGLTSFFLSSRLKRTRTVCSSFCSSWDFSQWPRTGSWTCLPQLSTSPSPSFSAQSSLVGTQLLSQCHTFSTSCHKDFLWKKSYDQNNCCLLSFLILVHIQYISLLDSRWGKTCYLNTSTWVFILLLIIIIIIMAESLFYI